MKKEMKKQVATENAEVRTIEWYEENLAKAEKEWSEIAQSYGAEDYQLVDLGFGDWIILNMEAECQETICEADGDFETITNKQVCDRLTYLNNVIDGWSKKIREMKEAQEKEGMINFIEKIEKLPLGEQIQELRRLNFIRCLVNEAKEDSEEFVNGLYRELLDNSNNGNNPVIPARKIYFLEVLCDELKINTPSIGDIFLRDGRYEMECKGEINSIFRLNNVKLIDFIREWVEMQADCVLEIAEKVFKEYLFNVDEEELNKRFLS